MKSNDNRPASTDPTVKSISLTKQWRAALAALFGFVLGTSAVAIFDRVARTAIATPDNESATAVSNRSADDEPATEQVATSPQVATSRQVAASPTAATEVVALKPVVAAVATGDWPQWGGSSQRNNVPVGHNIPTNWNVGGFDRKTRQWLSEESENIRWVAPVGSQTYGNAVVADGRVYIGTNNGSGHLSRYPSDVDLGCLICFSVQDGSFLWQHSSEKLSTGRVHDWPLQGICCAPLVEGDRLWFVTSRGEVVCLDTQGFRDGEDDGPDKAGLGTVFKESPSLAQSLERGRLAPALRALLIQSGVPLENRVRVKKIEDDKTWELEFRKGREKLTYTVQRDDDRLTVRSGKNDEDGENVVETPVSLTDGLDAGTVSPAMKALLAERGMPISDDVQVQSLGARKWQLTATVKGVSRDIELATRGPNLVARKRITVDDLDEADVIWSYDMMAKLTVSQHNMCSCSVTSFGDVLFVNSSNGVDESHDNIPSPEAPSFFAMNKHTGEVYWSDNSPGGNILHGQWSSPTIAEDIQGQPQVIFGGGDGWVYSFAADAGQGGEPDLLWKFDANPKTSEWILGGRGTRNNIIATPVVYEDRVYVAVGQDPEHGEGVGHLWCIDPTKRGDVSPELAVHVDDRSTSIAPQRHQAVVEEDGEIAIDNPNSAAIWHYDQFDQNGDGEFQFEESMHRSCGTVAIKDDLLYIADFSGLFHCLHALTGEVYWTYDMLAAAWGSPLIVDGKVYIGDEDGDVSVFNLSANPREAMKEVEEEKRDGKIEKKLVPINARQNKRGKWEVVNMLNSIYSTPIISDNVLYISNKTHLFSIGPDSSQ